MNRADDDERRRARRTVLRGALLWTPIFVVFAALAVNFLIRAVDGNTGTWIAFAITGLVGLLAGYSALAALRDLFAEPIETEATISRKWTKSDLFVLRGHYVMVDRRVFRVRGEAYFAMPDVGGRLYVLHYPHANTLVHWHTVKETAPLSGEGDGDFDAPQPTVDTSPERARFSPPAERVEPPSFGFDEASRSGGVAPSDAQRQPGDPP